MSRTLVALAVATCSLVAAMPGAFAKTGDAAGAGADPGVTGNSILLGGTAPLTGPAAAYASVARGADAYFKYANATRGGAGNGRKIEYKFVDDSYNPAQTVAQTRELVQRDRVFAIFNSLGTQHNTAVRSYLNTVRVPQLFVGSGATTFGRDYRRYPMTIGYLPSYVAEGRIYARHILKTKPTARIGVLYQNDDYGKDLLRGLERGLGAKRGNIVSRQAYEADAADVNSQITRLRGARATVLVIIATPRYAIQSFVAANRLGWRPQVYVNQVGSASNIMKISETSASARVVRGAITIQFLKDPTNPRFARDPAMRLYRQIMRRYNPRGDINDVFHVYSMAVAFTTVNVFRKLGRNVTRQGLLRQVQGIDERNNPFVLPGVRIKTSATDRFPIEQVQLNRWTGGRWVALGGLQAAKGL
jgi:branched-chain amino acid transport system substrate-binding protein